MNIIDFWFPDEGYQKFWFDKSLDKYIKENYQNYLNYYESFDINPNILSDFEILKIIIILDQFSRNIYRDRYDYNKNDKKALNLTFYFLKKRKWTNKKLNHLIFYIMPLRHNESLQNYNLIFKILNKINLKKLNDKEIILFDKFKKMTQIKYNKYINIDNI